MQLDGEVNLEKACAITGLEEKRLIGLGMRNDWEDPMIVDTDERGKPIFLDDWRLRRLIPKAA